MSKNYPCPFVLANEVVRACDYYMPITGKYMGDVSLYPKCRKCKNKCFKARWYNNGSHKYGKDFFCLNCDPLVNIDDKIENRGTSNRYLVCYDIDGNSIPFDDNTPRGKYGYSVVTVVRRVDEDDTYEQLRLLYPNVSEKILQLK